MKVASHQEKKNEKTSKRVAGEEKRQVTNFGKAVCCSSAVVQTAVERKNGLCKKSDRANWDPRKGQQPFRPNPNRVWDPHHHLPFWALPAGISSLFNLIHLAPSANAALPSHPRLQTSNPLLFHFISPLYAPFPPLMFLAAFLYLLLLLSL